MVTCIITESSEALILAAMNAILVIAQRILRMIASPIYDLFHISFHRSIIKADCLLNSLIAKC